MKPARDWHDIGFLHAKMAEHSCPGLSLVEIRDFEICWQAHLGVKCLGSTQPVTDSTIFQAASISKPVFALALMQMVEQGKMDLDEDVAVYLRSWRMPEGSPKVTLRQLLNHSAAATVDGFPGYGPGQPLPSTVQILNGQAPANTPPVRIAGVPGQHYAYSGGGMTVAQKAFEDVTGNTFGEKMEALVLGPLGLSSSRYEQPLNPAVCAEAAAGHLGGKPLAGGWNTHPELAAAGLWSSAPDLAHLGIAVMRRFKGIDSPLQLSPDSVQEMLSPRLMEQGPDRISVGVGWFCAGMGDDLTFGHNGGNEGYVAQVCFRPRDGSGLVFLANAGEAYPFLAEVMGLNGFSMSL